ncbi:MAG: hypothetical protein AABX29_06870 [Nanoarchaeota archaeon]
MSNYKTKKSRAVDACIMDFGAGAKCYFSSEECHYRGRIKECPYYQTNFMSDNERAEAEDKGLAMTIKALGLNKLNRNGKK